VAARGEDAVQPCLLVFVARSCEGSARKLFRVEAIRGLLGGVGADRERALYGFRSGEVGQCGAVTTRQALHTHGRS
jgi:hypothetical protein